MNAIRIALCTVVTAIAAINAVAQNYSIDWHKVAGGGGTSTNGQYTVSGTIGQHDTGVSTGGNYTVTGGFWSLINVVQTAGAPTLFITHSNNAVIVYWQTTAGWTLQQNASLSAPANWSASSGITAANGTNSITLVNPTGTLFFRLTK